MTSESTGVFPDGISDRHIRPVTGWRRSASPVGLAVFGLVVALAFSGLLGHERTWEAAGQAASLEVHAPEIIRNGEFFEMRVRVATHEPIGHLIVGIDEALWEDMTVNTLIPAAAEETSEDGEARFTFSELAAGTTFLFKIDVQVNPDIVIGNQGSVTIYDGADELATSDLSITVLP